MRVEPVGGALRWWSADRDRGPACLVVAIRFDHDQPEKIGAGAEGDRIPCAQESAGWMRERRQGDPGIACARPFKLKLVKGELLQLGLPVHFNRTADLSPITGRSQADQWVSAMRRHTG